MRIGESGMLGSDGRQAQGRVLHATKVSPGSYPTCRISQAVAFCTLAWWHRAERGVGPGTLGAVSFNPGSPAIWPSVYT